MGVLSALVLVLFLSQARFFNYLTDNALGRTVLLAVFAYLSYIHKMLGLLVVLVVILAFNYNDMNTVHSYNYYEGFTDGSGNDMSGNTMDMSGNTMDMSGNMMDMSGNMMDMSGNLHTQVLNAIKNKIAGSGSATGGTTSGGTGREGFCMSDKETNMLRGKQSNAIPVFNKSRTQPDNVNPTDSSVFSNAYSLF